MGGRVVEGEELELRVEGGNTLVTRIVDSSSPVERQDVAEQVRISVEEILAAVGVEKELLLVGTEQGVGEPIDGAGSTNIRNQARKLDC